MTTSYYDLSTDRPKEAEQCYRTALKIKPDHVTANTNMGHLCRIQGRWKEAVEHYTTASHRRPNNPILHYHIGNALIQIGGNKNFEVCTRHLWPNDIPCISIFNFNTLTRLQRENWEQQYIYNQGMGKPTLPLASCCPGNLPPTMCIQPQQDQRLGIGRRR